MSPLRSWAVGAALVIGVAGAVACGGGAPTVTSPIESPAGTTTSTSPAALGGALYFLGVGTSAGGLYSFADGTLSQAVTDGSAGFFQSATVSPDGTRYAWVPNDLAGGTAQLEVKTFDGATTSIGPSTISNDFLPEWSADGSSLIVGGEVGEVERLDAVTGAISSLGLPEGNIYFTFSPDGAYAVSGDLGDPARHVLPVGTAGPGATVVPPAGQSYSRFQSLSPDGHHAVVLLKGVNDPEGDAGRTTGANAIVDLTTGTATTLPGTLKQGFYRPDGNAVLRLDLSGVDTVVLLSPAGEQLASVVLPAAAANLALIAYIPAP